MVLTVGKPPYDGREAEWRCPGASRLTRSKQSHNERASTHPHSQRDGEMKVFTKVDMNKALHEVELHPVTTFAAPTGLYRYKRIVFVFNVASEKFNHVIRQVVQDGPRAFNAQDDLIVGSLQKADLYTYFTLSVRLYRVVSRGDEADDQQVAGMPGEGGVVYLQCLFDTCNPIFLCLPLARTYIQLRETEVQSKEKSQTAEQVAKNANDSRAQG